MLQVQCEVYRVLTWMQVRETANLRPRHYHIHPDFKQGIKADYCPEVCYSTLIQDLPNNTGN